MTFIYPQFNWGFTHAFSADNEKGADTISSACSFLFGSSLLLGSESCYLGLQFIQLRSHLFIFRLHLVIFLFQVLNLVRHFHFGITGYKRHRVPASQKFLH